MTTTAPFISRESQLQDLAEILQRCKVNGPPQFALIEGDFGVGKSTLIERFLEQARGNYSALQIAQADCTIDIELAPFSQVLQQLATQRFTGQLQQNEIAKFIFETAPAFLNLIPGIGPVFAAVITATYKRLPQTTFTEKSKYIQFTNALTKLTKDQRTIIFIDDFHHADLASIQLLYHLYGSLKNSPVMFIIAYRPVEALITGKYHQDFMEVKGDMLNRNTTVIDMKERGVNVEEYMLLRYIPNRFPLEFIQNIAAKTGGHAQYLDHLMRLLEDQGHIVQGNDTLAGIWIVNPQIKSGAIQIPNMKGVLDSRIAALADRQRQMLTQASAESEAGKNFTVQTIMRLSQLEQQRNIAFDELQQLERTYQLVASAGPQTIGTVPFQLYRFAHDWIQEHVYETLQEPWKSDLHQQIGEFLESLCIDTIHEISTQLALHFMLAGNDEKALKYILMTAQQEFERSAWLSVEAWVTRGEEILNHE